VLLVAATTAAIAASTPLMETDQTIGELLSCVVNSWDKC
jgi:hypothetical protein